MRLRLQNEIRGLRRGVGLFMGLLSGVGALLGLWTPDAHAQVYPGLMPGSRYLSTRGLAMGDAFQPLADDASSSLFYNPAGFGHIRGAHFEPINLSLQGNFDFFGQFGLDTLKMFSLNSYKDVLIQNPGNFPSYGAQVVSGFAMRGFGFALLARSDTSASYDVGSGMIRYRSNYQLIPAVGGGLRLASGILRLGYSAQWVNQASGTGEAPATDTVGYRQNINQGSALSHNAGAALTLPWSMLPQFDVVARNILGARFSGFSLLPIANPSAGVPDDERMTLDGSFMIQPKLGNGITLRWALVFRDFLNEYNTKLLARLSSGAEFVFPNGLFFRGGWGNGYPSAGIGFKRRRGELNLAWYSVERGAGFREIRDQHFIMQYQFRAF